jgi:radical SAM protein with 4Fe4S-binding SPASM domain
LHTLPRIGDTGSPFSGELDTAPSFADIWNRSDIFLSLRNFDELKGKCGACEFKKVCGGCRARAYEATGDFLAEEPLCSYQPVLKNKLNP